MKVGVMILNSMFLLLFISVIIGEWGEPPALVGGIGVLSIIINAIFILMRTKGDFEQ